MLSELAKAFLHNGRSSDWAFFRDHDGRELDCVLDRPGRPLAIEIKSSKRVQRAGAGAFDVFAGRLGVNGAAGLERLLICAGGALESDSSATLLPWNQLDQFDWLGNDRG